MFLRSPGARRPLSIAALALLLFHTQLLAQQPAAQGFLVAEPGVFKLVRNTIFGMYSGLALLMDVFTPEKPNGAAVILIEGSGWASPAGYNARPLKNGVEQWNALALPLIRAGYTVFSIDHRAIPRFHWPAQLEDAQRAVRFIRNHAQQYNIDPDRIAGVGYSSGAQLVSLLGLLEGAGDPKDTDPVQRESARVQCVIAAAVPSDLTQPGKNRDVLDALTAFIGDTVRANPAAGSKIYKELEEASPLHFVKPAAPPFLLIHGDADEEVPFQSSEVLERALDRVHVPVKLVRVKGATHDSLITEKSGEYADTIVHWLDENLRHGPQ